jgi:hypothetical protein
MRRWAVVVNSRGADPDFVDTWLDVVNELTLQTSHLALSHASRVFPDKKGTGDIVWSVILPNETHPREFLSGEMLIAPGGNSMDVCEAVAVEPIAAQTSEHRGERVLRTLLIKVRSDTSKPDVSAMERSLMAMPTYIDSILGWSLSRIAGQDDQSGWTHLWEQEFEGADGLRPYMAHVFHWTGVERWFDPEIPGHIVEELAHYVSVIPGQVLGP